MRAQRSHLSSPLAPDMAFPRPFFEKKKKKSTVLIDLLLSSEIIVIVLINLFMLYIYIYTKATASLAAAIMMSAHETTPGQAASTAALISSIKSYPRTLKFGNAVFSLDGPSKSIDASHPFIIKHDSPSIVWFE